MQCPGHAVCLVAPSIREGASGSLRAMTVRRWHQVLFVLAAWVGLVAGAPAASAHTGQGLVGVWAGLVHPFVGVDHLLAMITVGILAYTLGRDLSVPAAFLGAMTIGGALGMMGLAAPLGEWAIAISVLALGAALVAGAALRRGVALVLVGLAGLAHGHAHGIEAPSAAHPVLYVAGFLAATAALHSAGWVAGWATASRSALRTAAGIGVAGVGIGLLVSLA